MSKILDHKFKWSNGWGYTPCTVEYYWVAEALRSSDASNPAKIALEVYIQQLKGDGHTGEDVRYSKQDKEFAALCNELFGTGKKFKAKLEVVDSVTLH
jgi:hypothetical protein